MAIPKNGRFAYPQSIRQLENFAPGVNSQMAGFLLPFARRDYIYFDYDFSTSDTITAQVTAANGGGAAVSSFASEGTQTENGHATATTGTGTRTTSIVQLRHNALIFDAARNPGMEVRHKMSAVTDLAFEIAFAGPAAGTEALHNQSALSAAGVPTIVSNTITDQVGVGLNITSGTLHTMALFTKGTTDAASGALLGVKVPTLAVYQVVRIQARANGSYACIDDDLSSDAGLVFGADTGVLMRGSLLYSNDGAAGSKTILVDYWRLWAERL